MRTTAELENEIDRIIEIRDNADFVIKSLFDKKKYLDNMFQNEDEACKKAYELTGSIKADLESITIDFLAGNISRIDFDLSPIMEVKK